MSNGRLRALLTRDLRVTEGFNSSPSGPGKQLITSTGKQRDLLHLMPPFQRIAITVVVVFQSVGFNL